MGEENIRKLSAFYSGQAVKEDIAGNYARAMFYYKVAVEYIQIRMEHYWYKPHSAKELATEKCRKYLSRAEEIRAVLDAHGGSGPAANWYEAVPTRETVSPKDGGEDANGEGQEPFNLVPRYSWDIRRVKFNVRWDDVAGLENAKQAFNQGKGQTWRAFLLYGPPGTGKSYLAKAVATKLESTFFSVSCSDLVSKCPVEREKLVSNLFQMAGESAPSIIFVDEIDALFVKNGEGNESRASSRIKAELLVQMQGAGNNDQKVLVLAATDTPYALDQAIRRRFDKCFYIPLPDLNERKHMLKLHLKETSHNLTEDDFEDLACRTEGFSRSDISVCVNDALREQKQNTMDATFFIETPDGFWVPCAPEQPGAIKITILELAAQGLSAKINLAPITNMDFDKILARRGPRVNKVDLQVYERFTKEFGEDG